MEQEQILEKLHAITAKLSRLTQNYKFVCEELSRSRASNGELRTQIERQNEEIKNFQNQHKISKIVSSLAESTHNTPELRLKINEYIKEIDKCIAYLSE